jgi:hypothetical protein
MAEYMMVNGKIIIMMVKELRRIRMVLNMKVNLIMVLKNAQGICYFPDGNKYDGGWKKN